MPTWKLEIEYDGTRYRGWRMEHNQRTVQGEMMVAARQLFANRVEMIAAENTEPGVHARSNIISLSVPELSADITPRQILEGFNEILPHDINILKTRNADEIFHAWKEAAGREYVYQISTRRTAFAKNFVWWNKNKIDLAAMKKASEFLQGRLDLSSFADLESEKKGSTMVNLETASIEESDELILIRIRASRFLPKMFQRLVGNLAEVGRGGISVDDFRRNLNFKTAAAAKFTAPPSGAFLEKVIYKGQ
ncbi:MAG: hypothetical protein KIS76_13460 [Pyrinomonadaceae bacterium]|nr:hypothetical protein [Pyrinomonadaceae bacterium]